MSLPDLALTCYCPVMPPETIRNELRIHGRACKRIRLDRKLTQAQVATNAGMTEDGKRALDHTTVSYIEKGRPCTEPTMYAMAAGLGVDIDEITYQAVVYVIAAADTSAA